MKICNKTIMELTVERLKRVGNIDKIVLVTGRNRENEMVIAEAKKLNIDYFQGSEENVLDRFYRAALKFKPDTVIRTTCDNPLIDATLIEEGLKIFTEKWCDVVDNRHSESFYPHGSDFQIFKAKLLKSAWQQKIKEFNDKTFDAAFINPVEDILQNNKNIIEMHSEKKLSHIRLTLDYKEDLDLIETIYENLYKGNPEFALSDVLRFIETNPDLLKINKMHNIL